MIIGIKKATVLVIILALGFIYQFNYLNEFPSHIHAWAQSDRYALALGFIDNGFNFFKPQTFVYNHQFPDNWKVAAEETITAVDFPIHDYMPALLMKISGSNSPWIFRLYILLYSFLGLFYLFKLAHAITNNYLKSVFVVVFAATSPLFVYYQAGFLPTIPSLSNAILGIYFYYLFINFKSNKYFWLSLLFITLAALSRTTFAIAFVAIMGIEFVRVLKNESTLASKILPVSISILILSSYQVYNGYLRETYGSIFLNHLMPPKSFEQAIELLKQIYSNWFFQYFTKIHCVVFLILIIFAIYFFIKQKSSFNKVKGFLVLLTITYLFGCLIFAFLMLKQFPAHDYYFLDTFFLPIVIALILALSFIPAYKSRNQKIATITFFCFTIGFLVIQPKKWQEKRRETGFWDRTEATINNFKNADAFLDSLAVPKSSKILVIDALAPNIPFIRMQRKGFAVMDLSPDNIEASLKWNFDYIVLQNEYFIPEIYSTYPGILSRLNKIADNGKISVCKLCENNQQDLLSFLGLKNKKPVFEKMVDFENQPDSLWQNFNQTNNWAFTGTKSGKLTADMNFGLTFKTKKLAELKHKACTLIFSSYFFTDTLFDCEVVVSINADNQNIYYKTCNLKNIIKQNKAWIPVSQIFQLPKIESNDYEFAVFIWNTGKSELFYDNFSISMY